MLGRVMDFQFGGKAAGFSRRERFMRSDSCVFKLSITKTIAVCLREMDVDQVTQAVGTVNHGAATLSPSP